jgi:hypothetical protein
MSCVRVAGHRLRSPRMRMSACWILAVALVLAPSTCHGLSGDDRAGGREYDVMRLPRIHAVLEMDVDGSRSPSIRAEVSLNPASDKP